MKLLSLWEPWASLIALGAKRIETRSWRTSYRGWLAIQASKGGLPRKQLIEICSEPYFCEALKNFQPYAEYKWPLGCIVAVVYLKHCVTTDAVFDPIFGLGKDLDTPQERAFGDYYPGRYAWITDQCFRLPEPIPFKAAQGLCDVPPNVIDQLRQQWKASAA